MHWFESFIFGLVSGITELLPVSAPAHEALITKLFGMTDNPLLRLIVHAAIWEALYLYLRQYINRLLQERSIAKIPPKRRIRQPDPILIQDTKLLKTALIPLVLGFVAAYFLRDFQMQLIYIAGFLVLNGIILYIPGHMPSGNKDSRSITPLDSVLMGLAGALAILPGFSRIGALVSTAGVRGADKEQSLRWALLLNMIALLFVMGFDAYELLNIGTGAWNGGMLISCICAAFAAFAGAAAGIRAMNFLAFRTGFSGFAYYCWGAALFAFLMYLTI